jgi:phenylacetic acid degradation operon negative regulatory protein
LVHDFRRLLLRDPMLPPSLLPARWLGSKARALFKSLYALLLPASERHLDLHLMVAGDVTPSADAQVLKNRTAQAV